MSANFRSSKMRKSCFLLKEVRVSITDGSKSSSTSMCVLIASRFSYPHTKLDKLTLIKATYGPTVSITQMKSELLVTSTLTQRFDFLRPMVSKSCFAATFEKFPARLAYVC